MKAIQTLFLLAADQEFRLLRGQGDALHDLCHRHAADFPDVHDRFASEPSRGHTARVSYGTADRGAQEAEERRRLARHAVAALAEEWARAKDDRIVLVAGPKMLGTLRDLMPKALAGQVAADLAKDLVKVPARDLPDHLRSVPQV